MFQQSIAPLGVKKQPIEIVNGKLVILQETGLEDLSDRIAEISEKCEQLNLNTPTDPTAIIQQNQELYLNQVRGVKRAIYRLESLFRKFLFGAIAFCIMSIIVWIFFLVNIGKCWLIATGN